MSQISPDIFAYTNPAFCALVLRGFVRGYSSVDGNGVEFPLLYLPLPVILSSDFRRTLDRTEKRTGLVRWLQRNTAQLVGLSDALRSGSEYTPAAIRFGCSYGVLEVSPEGRFTVGAKGLTREPKFKAKDERGECLTRAERLGVWCGQIGSAPAIYNQLLISV